MFFFKIQKNKFLKAWRLLKPTKNINEIIIISKICRLNDTFHKNKLGRVKTIQSKLLLSIRRQN